MSGHGLLSRSITIYFRADCVEALGGRNLGVIYVSNPTLARVLPVGAHGQGGFLCVFTVGDINAPGRPLRRRHHHRRRARSTSCEQRSAIR